MNEQYDHVTTGNCNLIMKVDIIEKGGTEVALKRDRIE